MPTTVEAEGPGRQFADSPQPSGILRISDSNSFLTFDKSANHAS
jgi:hypothetical protein